jgi:hypothetical protein
MSFQDLEAGNVRGAPLGGGRRNGRGPAAGGAGASQAVASGVFQINTAVATFQRLVNTLGTPKDTPDLRDRMCVSPTLPPPSANLSSASRFGPRIDRFGSADPVAAGFDPCGGVMGEFCGLLVISI